MNGLHGRLVHLAEVWRRRDGSLVMDFSARPVDRVKSDAKAMHQAGVMKSTDEVAPMEFDECDPPATESAIAAFEERIGQVLPAGIRTLLLTANGGRPKRAIFRSPDGKAVDVSECLALRAGRGSIESTYQLLTISKRAMPPHMLPFAQDSGGNIFAVDCRTPDAHVYFLLHDPEFRLVSLGVALEAFWSRLTTLDAELDGAR
ncbi:MAG: SMI1/KNR4 family protein [Myxococcales bacterium]|nr:SMI1/KNR4 family protein [Myxococcales bacterium]